MPIDIRNDHAMPRYLMRCNRDGGTEIYDSTKGDANTAETAHGPMSWDSASRLAHELNGYSFMSAAPAPACPDCAKYRAALEQIAKCSGEPHVLRLANEALDMRGEIKC